LAKIRPLVPMWTGV